MKLYMAIIYLRRLKKGGYFGETEEDKQKKMGSMYDFTRVFGTEVKD